MREYLFQPAMPLLTLDNLVNVECQASSHTECHVALWVWRIVPFILIAIGTFGNLLNIVVLSGTRMRKYSTTVYLHFLSASDLVHLWVGMFIESIYSVSGVELYGRSMTSCKVISWLQHSSGIFSVWLLVMISTERALFTVFPLWMRFKMTPKFALKTALIALVFVLVSCIHLFYGKVFETEDEYLNITVNTSTKGFESTDRYVCKYVSTSYSLFYLNQWQVLLLTFGVLVPMVIIVTSNIIVAKYLLESLHLRRRIHPTVIGRTKRRNPRQGSAKMVFALSLFFIITTVPYSIFMVAISYKIDRSVHDLARFQLLYVTIVCLFACNFSFNFFLYFMTGTLFSEECKKLFQGVKKKLLNVKWCRFVNRN